MATFQFTMKAGPTPDKTFALNKNELFIGRELSNDIVITDADVSRRHARLTLQGDAYLLEDLGSTNGSFINGQRLSGSQLLQHGDKVKFGENVELLYEQLGFDVEATVMSSSMETVAVPEPMAAATTYVQEEFSPVMPAGEMPQQPALEVVSEPEKKGGKKVLLFAGVGCVLLCLCVSIVALGYFVIWPMLQTQ